MVGTSLWMKSHALVVSRYGAPPLCCARHATDVDNACSGAVHGGGLRQAGCAQPTDVHYYSRVGSWRHTGRQQAYAGLTSRYRRCPQGPQHL